MKWSRENLEKLNADLLRDNQRLRRINWGRLLAVGFFIFYGLIVWDYFTSQPSSIKSSKCYARGNSLSK